MTDVEQPKIAGSGTENVKVMIIEHAKRPLQATYIISPSGVRMHIG